MVVPIATTVPAMTTQLADAVRTAPWASGAARCRLHEIESGLPEDAAAAFSAATDAVAEHERNVECDALLLYAGGNVPSARVAGAHRPLLSNQPSMGYAGDKFQAGLDALDVVEVAVSRLVADVMGAAFAEIRPTSATLANLAVYSALVTPGETIAGGALLRHEL
jgi:glycine hydroxymethyltransferase